MLRTVAFLAAACLLPGVQELPQPAAPPPAAPRSDPGPLLDDGLLDPAWFGTSVPFTQTKTVDYFWSRPGLDLTGRILLLKPWDPPVQLHGDRKAEDQARSVEMTNRFPGMLWGALSGRLYGKAKVSHTEGDLVLIGRFVDVGAGSKKVRWLQLFGSGESATWDLKIVDLRTGELVLAAHHRAYTRGVKDTLPDRLQAWSGTFATLLATRAVK